MENASKALIMAGSVLMAILIIGALIFMFNSLSDLKRTETNVEDTEKLVEYNKKFETFNRPGLYGSEIVSLANLIEDYNKRQHELKGYTAISLKVTTNGNIANMDKNYTDYKKLISDYKSLEKIVNDAKNDGSCGTTIEKLSGLTTSALEQLIERYNKKESKNVTLAEVEGKIGTYLTSKTELTEFKNKKFENPTVEYDKNTGRISKMIFEEVKNN